PWILGVPKGFLSQLLELAWIPLAFTVLANTLYGPHPALLPHPSLEGFFMGVRHALAFWLTWLVFSLFWATTSPDELLRALRGSGRHEAAVAARDFWLTLELAIRFTPLLGEEAERLVLAQTARGERWGGSLARRSSQAAALMLPLLFSALRRAEGLADTLVARGFGSGPSTSAVRYRW